MSTLPQSKSSTRASELRSLVWFSPALCSALAIFAGVAMSSMACEGSKSTRDEAAKTEATVPDAPPKLSGAGPTKPDNTPEKPTETDQVEPAAAQGEANPDTSARRRAPPRPGSRNKAGTQAEGQPCDRVQLCAPGLGCSGLFDGVAGTCIAEDEAKSKCSAAGGRWGVWGLQRASFCMRTYADGGKSCTDSSQCKGKCLQSTSDESAHCEHDELSFGCFAEWSNGKAGPTICRD